MAPLGTVALASLLREHLIEMQRSNVAIERRAAIAQGLLKFVASPEFSNPIEQVVRTSSQLQDILRDEVKGHQRVWKKRWEHYQVIEWEASDIQANIKSVLHGNKPKALPRRQSVPLQLPASINGNGQAVR